MVEVLHSGSPVVVEGQLAVPPAGAEQEAGAQQDEAGGVAHHVGVVGPVGQTVRPTLRVQTLGHGPEDEVAVVISRDQPVTQSHYNYNKPVPYLSQSHHNYNKPVTYLSQLKSSDRTLFSSFKTLRQFPS